MTTQTDLDVASHKIVRDERVKERNRVQRLLIRPEMGAAIGAVAIFIFFLIVAPPFRSPEALATVLYASSTIGIMACAVALLMIGGEFDLSSGVAVTTSSLAASMLAYNLHLNLWAGAGLALIVALAVGFFNGYLVMKTKIPSFLITLGHVADAHRHQPRSDQTDLGSGRDAERERHAGLGFGAEGVLVVVHRSSVSRCGSPCSGGCCSPPSRPTCCSRHDRQLDLRRRRRRRKARAPSAFR